MEGQEHEPPIDAMLRGKALTFVLSLYATWGPNDEGDKDIDTTLEYAAKIYNFLKGDTK